MAAVLFASVAVACGSGGGSSGDDGEGGEIDDFDPSLGQFSVAVNGDVAAIGFAGDDRNGEGSGAVYVYEFDGMDWQQEAVLTASDAAPGDHFGADVKISDDVIVVRAEIEGDDGFGVLYVFRLTVGVWVEEQILTAADHPDGGYFQRGFAVEGDTIVVGALQGQDDISDDPLDMMGEPRVGQGPDDNSHLLYAYEFGGVTWTIAHAIRAVRPGTSTLVSPPRFGSSLDIDGDVLIAGVPADNENGVFSGSAYVFRFSLGSWDQEDKIVPADGEAGDQFGLSVAIEGDTAAIGAPGRGDLGDFSGAAYIFEEDAGDWNLEQMVTGSETDAFSGFGRSVAISADAVVVGGPFESHSGGDSSEGRAYVFRDGGGTWAEEDVLGEGDDIDSDRLFGMTVAIDGDRIVVGTDNIANEGFVFERDGAVWNEEAVLEAF